MGWLGFLRDYSLILCKLVSALVAADTALRTVVDNSYPFAASRLKYSIKDETLTPRSILLTSAIVCLIVLVVEILSISVQSAKHYATLRTYICFNSTLLTFVLFCAVLLGYIGIVKLERSDPALLEGSAFGDFEILDRLMNSIKTQGSISEEQNDELWITQGKIDAIQKIHKCCGENSWSDWLNKWSASNSSVLQIGPGIHDPPSFWFNQCYASNNICLVPRSCCKTRDRNCNSDVDQFYNKSCKLMSVEFTQNHLFMVSVLVTVLLVLTVITSYYRWYIIIYTSPQDNSDSSKSQKE